MRIECDGFEFDFTDAMDVFIFDQKDKRKPGYHGLSHAMKAVDLIVELPEAYLFVEIKDFNAPADYDESEHFNHLREVLKYKYRDSWLYRWAENKVDKPIRYLCLLNLENPLISRMTKELRKQLPSGRPVHHWQREIASGCAIVNLTRWNAVFLKWPAMRAPQVGQSAAKPKRTKNQIP